MFIIQSLVLCELLGLFVHWNLGGLHPFSPAFKLTLSHGGEGEGWRYRMVHFRYVPGMTPAPLSSSPSHL